ncbi:DNA-directed DNA polymerase X [Ophiocordyceps camponoti-floridani]|uniref:DNA polymerase n=1 Tax=Ophiocordyceps camponoti-floridani TaxID=2030778 RepID=A0A8H4Q0Z0_9HYPO|nr:DNA-directed DNA polymerase X [Ophiocordyceps camponoti-floridani]
MADAHLESSEKAAFFALWESLGADDEEEMDARERRDRRRRAAFFTDTTEAIEADETVIPDSVRPVTKTKRGDDSTPLPPRRAKSKPSPPTATPGPSGKKRKRGSSPKMKPPEEQIFRDLSFFFVPDNDIAPARRLRITRAREHGARWVRSAELATHVIVDSDLGFEDKKYRVEGAPVEEEEEEVEEEEVEEEEDKEEKASGPVEMMRGGEEEAVSEDDELARCMSMMHRYQHLPLDHDDDDDDASREGETSGLGSEVGRDKTTKSGGDRFEDGFLCNQAGEKNAQADGPNGRTIEVLQNMADYYERVDDHWRSSGYRKAIGTLRRQTVKVRTADEAVKLPQIGMRIAEKIEEIASTDRLRRLEYAQEEPTDEALQLFLHIYGVGSKLARQWVARGYRTLDDVARGARLTASQRVGLEHYHDLRKRIPRREVEAIGEAVRRTAMGIDPGVEFITGGSYRRGADSSGDVDLIVTKKGTFKAVELLPFLDELVDRLEAEGIVVARLSTPHHGRGNTDTTDTEGGKDVSGGLSIWHGCCVLPRADPRSPAPTWRRLDMLLVPETQMGGALLYFTGDDLFNRSMRLLARRKGLRLNQRGLFRGGELVEGRDEGGSLRFWG